jgi:F-box protein 9
MTLQHAVASSDDAPYDNNLAYPSEPTAVQDEEEPKKMPAMEDDHDSENEDLEEQMESERIAATERLPTEELLQVGGQILVLPDELLHRVFDFLPVDTYASLALVSPHWKSFTRTEAVYKRLCERLYLNQSKRRALHVSRFGNSYRTMLERRPRVRAGGGVYVMKYARPKPIQRDMWTEVGT